MPTVNLTPIPSDPNVSTHWWREWFRNLRDKIMQTEAAAPLNIVVMGDSFCAQNTNLVASWPSRFGPLMNTLGANVVINNLSVAAHTFFRANTYQSFGSNTMVEQAINLNPDLIIIALGVNDTITQVDSRSLAQVTADAGLCVTTLRAALPNAVIVFTKTVLYDTTNFSPATCKNKGVIPYLFTLKSAGILTGTYTSEMLDDAISGANQTLLTNQDTFNASVAAFSALDGSFTYNHWQTGRLGCITVDGLHPTYEGLTLYMSRLIMNLRANTTTAALFPTLTQQTNAVLYDVDQWFAAALTASGTGYVTATPANSSAERISLDLGPIRLVDTEHWYLPYKTRFTKDNLSYSVDNFSITTNIISNGPPNTEIYTSLNGAAFVDTTVATDAFGNFFHNALGLNGVAGTQTPGSYTLRFKCGSEVYGPFTVVLTATTQPYLKVRRVAAWTPAANPEIIPFDTVDSDNASGWGAGTYLYTIPSTGKYAISCYVKYTSANIGDVIAPALYVSGTRTLDGSGQYAAAAGIPVWGNVNCVLDLVGNATISVYHVGTLIASAPGAVNGAIYLTIQKVNY